MMPKPAVLSNEEMEQAVLLIKVWEHILTGPGGRVGFTDVTHHDIDMGDRKAIKCQVQ